MAKALLALCGVFILFVPNVLNKRHRGSRLSSDWNDLQWSWIEDEGTEGFWKLIQKEERDGRGGSPEQWQFSKPEMSQETQVKQSSHIQPEIRGSRIQNEKKNEDVLKKRIDRQKYIHPGSGNSNSESVTDKSEIYINIAKGTDELKSRKKDTTKRKDSITKLFNKKQVNIWGHGEAFKGEQMENQLERVKFDEWLEEEAAKLLNGEDGSMLDALHQEVWSDSSTTSWRDSSTTSWMETNKKEGIPTKHWHKNNHRIDSLPKSVLENDIRGDYTTHSWHEKNSNDDSIAYNLQENSNERVWQHNWDRDEMTTRGGSWITVASKTQDRRRWEDTVDAVTENGRLVAPENWTEGDRIKQLERLKVDNNMTVTKCQTADDCMSHQVCYLPTNECKDQLTFSLSQRSACTNKANCGENQICYLPTKECICNIGYIEESGSCISQTTLTCFSSKSNATMVDNNKGWGIIPYCKAWGTNSIEKVCEYGDYSHGTGIEGSPMMFTGGSKKNCGDKDHGAIARSTEVHYSCYCDEVACDSEPDHETVTIWWGERTPCSYVAYIFTPLACTDGSNIKVA